MAAAAATMGREQETLAIDRIVIKEGFNAREVDEAGLAPLVESIKEVGVLVPLLVGREPANGSGKHQLFAGERRLLAARKAGLKGVPVTFTDVSGEAAMVVENVVREELTPVEEARAVEKLLGAGYNAEGAAKVLGWSKQRVTRRARLLELPDEVRALWGEPINAPADALPLMQDINAVAPWLAELIAREVKDRADLEWADERLDLRQLVTNPREFLRLVDESGGENPEELPEDATIAECPGNVRLGGYGDYSSWPQDLRDEQKRIEEMRHALNQYHSGVELTAEDADRARAAGVLIEVESSEDVGWVTSKAWLVDAVRLAQANERETLEKAVAKAEKKAAKDGGSPTLAAASAAASSGGGGVLSMYEREQKLTREIEKRWREEAREPNLELGRGLLNKLSKIDPADIDVAVFFVYGLLGRNRSQGVTDYMMPAYSSDNAAHLAARGLRFVFEDWQTVEKSSSGKVKIQYLEVEQAEKRLWDWLGQATTAGEVFGRGLIIYAAAKEALDVVLARSNRVQKSASTGNKDADAALAKILKHADLQTPALTKLANSMKRWSAADQAKKQVERETKPKAQPKAKPAAAVGEA